MPKFTYMVEEVLRRNVTVEAEDADIARAKVQEQYNEEEIVLSADDFYEYVIYLEGVEYEPANEN